MRARDHSGFTLIELSIVLVIIGLLVGGVLVARDLIEAASVRKDMATVEKYNTAIITFKMKYNALPGDMTNPTQFGFDANAYGDGNGKIVSDYFGCTVMNLGNDCGLRPEWFYVAHHLGRAGLIELSGNYEMTWPNYYNYNIPGAAYPKMYSSPGSFTFEDTQGSPPGILLIYEQNNRVSNHYFRMGACR
jgi:prepilin-type N-terminal cleavage/methylation domain-containing protein